MLIDTRFLSVHPATLAWWQQRQQCQQCKHCAVSYGQDGQAIMRCAVSQHKDPLVRRMHAGRTMSDMRIYCIDARDEGGDCGPDAKLWEGKE